MAAYFAVRLGGAAYQHLLYGLYYQESSGAAAGYTILTIVMFTLWAIIGWWMFCALIEDEGFEDAASCGFAGLFLSLSCYLFGLFGGAVTSTTMLPWIWLTTPWALALVVGFIPMIVCIRSLVLFR